MRRTRRAVLLVAALSSIALVGASGAPGLAETRPGNGMEQAASPTLLAPSDGYTPSESPYCRPGVRVCVDVMVREMIREFDRLGCDHNAAFSLLYLRTTQTIADHIDGGNFDQPKLLNHWTYLFGRYYLDAYHAWDRGQEDRVPEAWRIAFDAAAGGEVTTLGNVMLGINAHVARDLPFVLAEIGLHNPDGSSRLADHREVDVALGLARATSVPSIRAWLDDDIFDQFEGARDGIAVEEERAVAWEHAELLLGSDPEMSREEAERHIEEYAAGVADRLRTSFATDERDVERRDAYCASQLDQR